MYLMRLAFAVLVSVMVLSCGLSSDPAAPTNPLKSQKPNEGPAATPNPIAPPVILDKDFKCNGIVCDASQNYCLLTENKNREIYFFQCAKIPNNINRSCEWATQNAKESLANVENCKHMTQCELKNNQITVTCTY